MNQTACKLSAVIVWSLFAACHFARADELSIKPREGVLLLTNGELLSGTIIPAGDRYDVHLPNGEIHIRRADVAMVCADAAECYRQKRSGIEAGRVQDHVELAEWCVKNRLLTEAEAELQAARAADPKYPKIPLVESRLALAREPLQASATQGNKPVSQAPLESMARTLPAGAMENYTTTIQPLLLNYCAKGGCHAGRGSNTLALERVTPKLSGRYTTQRNLQRVLDMVDRQNPSESKLLQAPIRAHGTTKGPIFTDREQAQYRQLVQWVYQVAGARATAAAPTLEERTAPLLQTVSRGKPGSETPTARPEAINSQAPTGPSTNPADAPPADDLAPTGTPRDGRHIPASSADQAFTREQLRSMGLLKQALSEPSSARADVPAPFAPKDPFDPEIFNRRFFGK